MTALLAAPPRRPRSRRLLVAGIGVGTVALLTVVLSHGKLPRLAFPPHPIGWLVAMTAVAIAISYLSAASALRAAAGRPLPWGRTVLAQLAAAFVNRLMPAGIGGAGVNFRYLQKSGLTVSAPSVAVTLVAIANGIAALAIAIVVAPLAATRIHVSHLLPIAAASAAAAALVTAAIFCSRRRLPARVRAHLFELRGALSSLRSDPKRLAVVFAGALGVKLAHIGALLAALAAFGSDLHAPVVIAIYLAGTAAASAAPTPNGLGAVEAALVSGLVAAGGPVSIVVGGVLVFRLASFWMPIVPGMAATWILRRKHAV